VPPLDLVPEQVTPELVASLAAGLGLTGAPAGPVRMAPVNALLDLASPAMREALLVAFLDRLQRPIRAPG
jgi:hypothetical protein